MIKSSRYIVLEKVTVLKQRNLFEFVRATRKDSRESVVARTPTTLYTNLLPGIYVILIDNGTSEQIEKLVVQ